MTGFKSKTVGRANIAGFLIVIAVAILASLFSLGTEIDRELRNIRYTNEEKTFSGEIVFIAMDEKSLKEIGNYPWRRAMHGKLIDNLQGSGVKQLGFDIGFIGEGSYPQDNVILAKAIKDSDFRVGVAVPGNDEGAGPDDNKVAGMWPLEMLTDAGAETYSIWADTNEKGHVEYGYPTVNVDNAGMASFASWLTGIESNTPYVINWSYDPLKIKTFSYADVVKGNFDRTAFKDKKVVVGPDASIFNDKAAIPTGMHIPGSRAHIISAETQAGGAKGGYSEAMIILITALLCGMLLIEISAVKRYAYLCAVTIGLVAYQWHNESSLGLITPVGGALLVVVTTLAVALGVEALKFFFSRVMYHEGTRVPNLVAMKMTPKVKGAVVAVKINNNLDILNELGPEGRDAVMARVAKEIEAKAGNRQIFQIDDSTFAWKADALVADENWQIEAILNALKLGIQHENSIIDVHVTAGVEPDETLKTEKGVNNAIIAANRAQARGIGWEFYEKSDTDEKWKISVVSEINRAIEDGHIWVAYQPKVDSGTNRVTGAEALVRWKHPEKGDIRPDAFIPLLEKANRTEDLTRFMLDKALSDFSTMNEGSVAVNVSPTMISAGKLHEMVKDALEKHGYNPKRLTIEITESEKFSNQDAIDELYKIHEMGVNISIDDYGMGNSTVNYLRIIPASELKIDRSFIANVLQNKSDRMVVASTIHLAHEMGLKVVAEGVETEEIQSYLNELKCDFIQGYHTGRPVAFEDYRSAAELSYRLTDNISEPNQQAHKDEETAPSRVLIFKR